MKYAKKQRLEIGRQVYDNELTRCVVSDMTAFRVKGIY